MDFGDFESGCSASNLFSVAYIREDRFFQDTQHRSHRSPRKKLRATRTSASLVIDQLKNDFRRPGDFTPRMRTRRNWRPEFLMKYLRDNQHDCNEECTVIVQHRERSYVPEMPKIYSIGLHSSSRSLNNSNNLSNLYGVTRNFKKRFDIVLRPMFIYQYWIDKSTSNSTSKDVSLKIQKNCQTAIIDCTESANISKHDRIQKNNYNQSYEHTKEKSNDISDSLRSDYAAGDRSFISNDFKDSSVRKEYRSCATRDSQTSDRKNSQRKKTKKRSKLADEGISHRKHRDNELRGRIIADFRVNSHNSNRRNHYEKSRLCVQVSESKHADYINKFTAVNRQIEEITATLRETCYNDNNSRSLENCVEYFSLVSDDAKINMNQKSDDVENKFTIARGRNKKTKGKDNLKEDVKKIRESDRRKNMLQVLHLDDINDELLDPSNRKYSNDTIVSSINPTIKLNDVFLREPTQAFSIDKTVYPLNRNSENKKKEKCHFVKQISFDLDLTKNDKLQEQFSIETEAFDEVHVRNNFIIPSDDKHAKDLIEDFADLEESRYHKKIVREKVSEMAILEDIKKRIDRDLDDRLAENDTEDFLTVSQKSNNFDLFYEITSMEDVASVRTLGESKSTSLLVSGSPNLDLTEIQVRNSMSVDAVSEHSNKNSEYFSCTQFPSMVSFAENEDELAFSFENNITAHDSNSLLNYNYYDCSRSNLNLNNFTRSNMDTSFDSSYSNSEYISPNKFPIEMSNAMTDTTFELSENQESFMEEICERPFGEIKRREKDSRVEFEKRGTADSTFETSKSSRYIGSIDSGVFSSSLIDLHENSVDKTGLRKKSRVEKYDEPLPLIVDFNSDSSSCTEDSLDQRVNDVVRDLTEKLIICERRMKLKKMRKIGCKTRDTHYYSRSQTLSRTCKLSRNLYDAYYNLFNSPRRSSENERIVSISTPTLLSLSDSEIENRNELSCV